MDNLHSTVGELLAKKKKRKKKLILRHFASRNGDVLMSQTQSYQHTPE